VVLADLVALAEGRGAGGEGAAGADSLGTAEPLDGVGDADFEDGEALTVVGLGSGDCAAGR
jgi:hypothetical protein